MSVVFVAERLSSVYIAEGDRGSTVVKVLCYKSEGHWFDPSWCHWNLVRYLIGRCTATVKVTRVSNDEHQIRKVTNVYNIFL